MPYQIVSLTYRAQLDSHSWPVRTSINIYMHSERYFLLIS